MSFLTAAWKKLALANYVVDAQVLTKYLPAGTELDLWQGRCYLSLVGFMFVDTKVLGIKVPFHTSFEEVNLRFYVKRNNNGNWKRGVVFIKELVPRRALAFVANTVYHENYEALPMKHTWETKEGKLFVAYQWKKANRWQKFLVEASEKQIEIIPESEASFITEHYWGYAKVSETQSNEYEVTHPTWKQYNVLNYEIDIDYEATYGPEFGFLNRQSPVSVILAEGSEITVEPKSVIRI